MSILVQVSELAERVRLDCGLPDYTADTNVTSNAILSYVKRSAQKLSGVVQRAGAGEQYLTNSYLASTVVGVPLVSLPTNALDVIRIAMQVGSYQVPLEPATSDEWDPNAPTQLADYTNTVPRYRPIGNTITLFPTPQYVREMTIYYTLGFQVTALADYLAIRPFWDEYVVANCCVLVRKHQEKMDQEFIDERDRCEMAIKDQIKRDRHGKKQVQNVRGPVFPRGVTRRGYY